MSLKRLVAISRKETIQILRDRRSLLVVVLMPIVLMMLMGYGFNLDQTHIPLCAFDREQSQQSQALLKSFISNRYFDLVLNARDYDDLSSAVELDRCTIGVVIPPHFSRLLREGKTVSVQAVVDGSDNNTALLVIGYAQQIVAGFSSSVQLDFLRRAGLSLNPQPLVVEARTWFNEGLRNANYMVPGVVAVVMAVIGTFLPSLTIVREWEHGTMEQLISTPAERLEVIAGKLVPYFAIGMFDTAECFAITRWWFDVPLSGSVGLLLSTSALFLLAVLLMGLLISAISPSQLAAAQFSLVLTFLPSLMLSGFPSPMNQEPAGVQLISLAIPARYYVSILRSLFLKGSGFTAIAWEVAALATFAVVAGALTVVAFRKKLA